MSPCVHIVPHLPPQNSGVGDYATLVGRRMEELGVGVVCGYIAAGCNREELPPDGERVRNITGACDAQSLWRAVEELAIPHPPSPISLSIVLHYSGYGFGQNGCPDWLVDALRNRPSFVSRVVTYFHELYATSPPWRRAFWYSASQQRIAAEVAGQSDAILTNCRLYARWLEEKTRQPTYSVPSLSVPSNVGEPKEVPELEARPLRAVTFGNVLRKRFALYSDAKQTAQLLQRLRISELVDIGAKCNVDRRAYERSGISVIERGYLNAAETSRALLECRLGLLHCNTHKLGKSGTYAAFAAHGVVPVIRCVSKTPVREFPYLTCRELADVDWPYLQVVSASPDEQSELNSSRKHAMAILRELFRDSLPLEV